MLGNSRSRAALVFRKNLVKWKPCARDGSSYKYWFHCKIFNLASFTGKHLFCPEHGCQRSIHECHQCPVPSFYKGNIFYDCTNFDGLKHTYWCSSQSIEEKSDIAGDKIACPKGRHSCEDLNFLSWSSSGKSNCLGLEFKMIN